MARMSKKDIIEFLEEDEHAVILDAKGNFKGILAPYAVEDFDQLPRPILDILYLLYGDQVKFTQDRTLH